MRRFIFGMILACAAVVFAIPLSAFAGPKDSPYPSSLQGKPIFVRIHADWCLECKATQPAIDLLHQKYGNKLHYVEFDVTDAKTSMAAAATAKRLHLSRLYEHDKTLPSSVSIINPRTGRVIARFWDNTNEQDYINAIDTALKELASK
jgi:thiol-disulfide isomerase/thioredoxin